MTPSRTKDRSREPGGPSPETSGLEGGSGPGRRRTWLYPAAAIGVVVLLVAGLLILVAQRDTGVAPDPERIAELEEAEDDRHVEQVGDLIDVTQDTHDALLPVLEGLDAALPEDEGAEGEPADSDEVEEWAAAVDGLSEEFETAPSGATDHNVARNGLRTSVDLFGSAVGVYSTALEADEELRTELEEHAASLRTQAVRAWSVSATQLDALAIDTGHGHVHIYLPADPGSGAMQPDGHPEGAEAMEPAEGDEN